METLKEEDFSITKSGIIDKMTTSETVIKTGWYSDNFKTYFIDDNGIKHYRQNTNISNYNSHIKKGE